MLPRAAIYLTTAAGPMSFDTNFYIYLNKLSAAFVEQPLDTNTYSHKY